MADGSDVSTKEHGPHYQGHLLEEYKLYVEMADRVSQRRATANSYLVTVNTFLVALYGLAPTPTGASDVWMFCVPVAGVMICIVWDALLREYRSLNREKFNVIQEMEERLPAAGYTREWELIKAGGYRPLSTIEQIVPWVFVGLYTVLAMAIAGG